MDWIQRAKEGDAQAFDQLIESHRDVMFRYAYLIVRDAHLADDVTQEAVLRIYRYIRQFDEAGSFRPWALQITRNVARNQNRARGRYKHMLSRLINIRQPQVVDVELLTHQQRQAQDLHRAVSQLPEAHQDVIYARYFLDLSVEECAIVLGIAEGTVKSRSHRALRQLKAVIIQHYPQLKRELPYE